MRIQKFHLGADHLTEKISCTIVIESLWEKREKKILPTRLLEKKILDDQKSHPPPPPSRAKWSAPYMIQCRQCENIRNTPAEYFGQTKRALRDRFGEHRRAIQHKTDAVVPQHFNPKGHKLADVELIPLELIISKRESVRRARE